MYNIFFLYLALRESVEASLCAELENVGMQLKTKDKKCHTFEQIYLWFSIAVELVLIPQKVQLH